MSRLRDSVRASQGADPMIRYGCIYRYLELIWYLALETPVLTQDEIEARTSVLANLLARQTG